MGLTMRAAFALLADRETHNFVRKIAWQFHQKYHSGTRHASLPPHISLKQPFHISDLTALEAYMDELAKSITPFEVRLTELQIVPISFSGTDYGLLWIDVEETGTLRGLHNRLNEELNQRFGNTAADFDGEAYHFHMTVMMGGQTFDVYQKFLSEITERRVNIRFIVRELAMFVYDDVPGPDSEYLCYKILSVRQ